MKYIRLLRVQQWYKNLLLFLALFFSGNLLNTHALSLALIGFASFCVLSSATYIINDTLDRNKDRLHPEKSKRPIASGAISIPTAAAILCVLLLIGFGLSLLLPITFTYAALGYFVLSQIYSIWLKHEAFADIITIAVNFVIRAAAGAFAISVSVSAWLILGIFFLALFLLLGKRKGELTLLKEKAVFQRKTLAAYTPQVVERFSALATTLLIICYALYAFFGNHKGLYLTLPIALYAILRYEFLISTNSPIARNPEYVFSDTRMIITMVLWSIVTFTVLYYPQILAL